MRRRLLLPIVILLLLPVAGAAGYWAYAASAVKRTIADWVAAQRAGGVIVRHAGLAVTGFPFRIRVRIAAPEIARPDGKTPWHWRGPAITAEARPWNHSPVALAVSGTHYLAVGNAASRREYRASAVAADGMLTLDPRGRPLILDMVFTDLAVARQPADAADRLVAGRAHVVLSRPQADTRADMPSARTAPGIDPRPPATLTITIDAESLTLPEDHDGALGRNLATLGAEATLFGEILPGNTRDALALWRQTGGVLEFARLGAVWGPLTIKLSGTAALDAALQPVGAFTGTVRGYDETLQALVANGRIGRDAARMAGLVLGMASHRPADGGPRQVTLPLSVQEQRLYLGPVALLRLPTLNWD